MIPTHLRVLLPVLFLALPGALAAQAANLSAAAESLAEELMDGIRSTYTGTLDAAVYPFVETFPADAKTGGKLTSSETLLARAVQGQLAGALGRLRFIRLLDRQTEQVLSESDLQKSDRFDPETIARYGKLVGAKGVIVGEILNLVDQVQVTVRAVEVESALNLATATITVDAAGIDCQLLKNCGSPPRHRDGDFDRQAATQQTLTVDGLQFSLQKCIGQGDVVTCRFLAEHHVQGKMNLTLALGDCTATFADGTPAFATRLTLGTDRVNHGHGLNFAVYGLPPSTPTAVVIEFGELPSLPTKIRNLQVGFRQRDRDFNFFDVPVVRN